MPENREREKVRMSKRLNNTRKSKYARKREQEKVRVCRKGGTGQSRNVPGIRKRRKSECAKRRNRRKWEGAEKED